METFVADLKDLTERLFQKQNANTDEIIENLFSIASTVEPGSLASSGDSEVEENAIQLWNWAVTKHVGSAISDQQKAKVRHVACRVLYACETDNPSESTLRRQILMATKTGRTWLDCKDPKMADNFFNLTVKSLEVLYSKLACHAEGRLDINVPKRDVEKDLLRLLTYQAESAVMQDSHQEAVSHIFRCKDMLMRLPQETGYLSLLCYNFGVDTYNLRKYRESSFWLSQSYDIGKMNKKYSPGPSVQSKVLRLLATVYMEWDCHQHQEKALNAVNLANKESVHPSGLYLKIRILLTCKAHDEQVQLALTELLGADVPLDTCLSAVRLLMTEDREGLAFELLQNMCQLYESSPELGTALVLHAQLLLQSGRELLGKQKVEDIIAGHYSGKQLSPQSLCILHLLLWDRASQHFEAQEYTEALQWYNYSLSFYTAGTMDQNLAKLQRNRASCFLHLQQLEKAKEATREAERCDPESPFTQFSVYRISLLEKNNIKAVEALRRMGKQLTDSVTYQHEAMMGPSAASNLLSLAAQMALELEQQDLAINALECLCERSPDGSQVLMALRCLIRLALSVSENTREEIKDVNLDIPLSYLKTALQQVSQLTGDPCVDIEKRAEAAGWFRKIAWNLALQCEGEPNRMTDFFLLSYQFSQFCPTDRALLMSQKTCLLMAAAACLELQRKSANSAPWPELLSQALEHIESCREVWKTLKATGDFHKDPTDTLLLLYEFEARVKLNDPKARDLLQATLAMDTVEAKTLETVAALAVEPPAHFPLLSKEALKQALSLHRKRPQVDLARCSQCIRSLIELSLPSGVAELEPCVLEELWGYYQEALTTISAAAEFPELETLWLLTRAWNTGVLLHSLAQYCEAERWCSLAMSFLRYLGASQDSYQAKMSGLYTEVLDRLDKAKRSLVMEE